MKQSHLFGRSLWLALFFCAVPFFFQSMQRNSLASSAALAWRGQADTPPTIEVNTTGTATLIAGCSGYTTNVTVSDAVTPPKDLRIEAVLPAGFEYRGIWSVPNGTPTKWTSSNLLTANYGIAAGQYKITLRVTNTAGLTASAEFTVTVETYVRGDSIFISNTSEIQEGRAYRAALFNQWKDNINALNNVDWYFSDSPDSFTVADRLGASLDGKPLGGTGLTINGGATIYHVSLSAGLHELRFDIRQSRSVGQSQCFVGTATKIFPLRVKGATSDCAYPDFQSARTLEAATLFTTFATGDFNGDGRADVAALDKTNNLLKSYVGQANGSLQLAGSVSLRRAAASLAFADFTRDGKLDVAVSYFDAVTPLPVNERGLTLFAGAGNGTFTLQQHYDLGHGYVATGDFNKDQHPDLAVTETISGQPGRLHILLNNAQGQLSATASPVTATLGARLVVAHLDADDNLDILTVPAAGDLVEFRGDGKGGFQLVPYLSTVDFQQYTPLVYTAIHAADFDGDGQPEAAATTANRSYTSGDNALRIFSSKTRSINPYQLNELYALSVAVADFNGDGKPDVATDTGRLLLTGGTQTPHCARPQLLPGALLAQVGAGDFNGDGRPDVIGTGKNGGLHLFLNQTNVTGQIATTSAASFTPGLAAPEQIIAIFGTNFSTNTEATQTASLPTTLSGTRVMIRDSNGNERLAPLFFVSPNQINALVPPDVAQGSAKVLVTNSSGLTSSDTLTIHPLAPGLFAANANGQGIAAAQALRITATGAQSYEPIARYDQTSKQFVAVPIDLSNASEQVFLILYGTGIRGRSSLASVASTIGGTACETLYAGAQGSLVGLDQVNVRLPRTLTGRGEVDVAFAADGKAANAVQVNIR